MNEQQKIEISGRLRELKSESNETNESIADFVGVKERTVAGWVSPSNPQAITYDNAKKVAQLFGVSIDYIWRGREDIRVPADFMERFAALEERVKELSAGSEDRAGRASGAVNRARQKSPRQSQGTRSPKGKKNQAQ